VSGTAWRGDTQGKAAKGSGHEVETERVSNPVLKIIPKNLLRKYLGKFACFLLNGPPHLKTAHALL
jgi:hypothetical protein